jgi:hypothetical protein
MKNFTLILLLIIASSFVAPKTVQLEYRFTAGDQYEWIMDSKQTIKQNIMGTDQVYESAIKGSLLLNVVSVTNTDAKVEAQYISLSMETKMPVGMGSQLLDSKGDTSKIENKIMKSLTNKTFTLIITKHGIIQKVEGEENLWSDFSSLGVNNQQITALKSNLEQNLNEGAIKASFETIFIAYPDKKIATGETWKNKSQGASMLPVETENTWTLGALTAEEAKISADGITSTVDKQKVISLPNEMKCTFDLSGTQKLSSTVTLKTGWASAVTIHAEQKGKMNLLAGGMIPQDMEIPMEITNDSAFKIVKKK